MNSSNVLDEEELRQSASYGQVALLAATEMEGSAEGLFAPQNESGTGPVRSDASRMTQRELVLSRYTIMHVGGGVIGGGNGGEDGGGCMGGGVDGGSGCMGGGVDGGSGDTSTEPASPLPLPGSPLPLLSSSCLVEAVFV
jgi:hypothetical protein